MKTINQKNSLFIIEKVENPWRNFANWRKRKGIIVFDIETNWAKKWTEEERRNATFKCGVAYIYDEDRFYEFTDPIEFIKLLRTAKVLVSYNGEGFDFLVLKKYGLEVRKYVVKEKDRWKPENSISRDIMYTIYDKNREKKYVSLERLMIQHYGIKKAKYNPNDMEQLLKHCREDVEYTKKLYEEKIWQVPRIAHQVLLGIMGDIPDGNIKVYADDANYENSANKKAIISKESILISNPRKLNQLLQSAWRGAETAESESLRRKERIKYLKYLIIEDNAELPLYLNEKDHRNFHNFWVVCRLNKPYKFYDWLWCLHGIPKVRSSVCAVVRRFRTTYSKTIEKLKDWKPKKCKTEKDYENSLYNYLHKKLGDNKITKQPVLERSHANLMIDGDIIVKLKHNLNTTTQYQQLKRQLAEYKKAKLRYESGSRTISDWGVGWKNGIILLIGKTDKNIKKELNEFLKKKFPEEHRGYWNWSVKVFDKK